MDRNNDNVGEQNDGEIKQKSNIISTTTTTTLMMMTNTPTSNETSAENSKTKTERNIDGDCTIINMDNDNDDDNDDDDNNDNKRNDDDESINEIAAQLESIGPKNENATHLLHHKQQQQHMNIASTSSSSSSSSSSPFNCNENSNSASNSNNNNAFETKVKQISKNLKETTLAETTTPTSPESTTIINNTLPEEIGTMATILPIIETAMPSGSNHNDDDNDDDDDNGDDDDDDDDDDNNDDDDDDENVEINNQSLPNDASVDESDGRSKKVRFHPDVKENDGGNRVMPKKKKKLKGVVNGKDGTVSNSNSTENGDEMDLDEDDEPDEEEFDLAKTLTEAQDYLKTHPLMFSCAHDNADENLQNGKVYDNDDNLPHYSESSEDEDPFENVQPEFGVVRILGKHVREGSVEFLLRYVDRQGIFWETQETLVKKCPTLLDIYEQSRERRQTRLMRHVAKRQNVRQHYTDF